MLNLRPASYRVLLLASVGGVALAGGARATNYTNSSPTTNAGASYSLHSGDTLGNSSSVTSTGAGQPAVQAGSGVSSITNSGLIQATGANGIGVQVVSGGSVGSITNSGTVQTTNGGNAIMVGDTVGAAATVGTIANSGLIQSTGNSAAVEINAGSTVTAILNSGGTIQALGNGNAIDVAGAVGTITNSGIIGSSGGAGIKVALGGSVGGIANSGTISSIVNSGMIVSPLATGISVGAGGAIVNGITNTASGLIEGGPSNGSGVAIDNSAGTSKLTVNNAGTIIGAIKLGAAGDTLNVTGGAITGAIVGLPGGSDVVNFSSTGAFTTGGSISNVDTINVTTGTLVLQNAATSAYGGSAFNIASGAVTDMNAAIGATTVNNAGLLNVGSGSQIITGNYMQAASGSLGVTVLGTGNAGKLTVTGTATILGGANAVSVHVPTSVNAFALLNDSWHVLTSGALTANAAALTASSDNPGIGFGLTDSSTDLILSALAQTPNQILAAAAEDVATIFAAFPGTPNFNQVQARLFLEYVFVGLVEHGQTALANQLYNVLADSLSPAQALQFNNQLMPSALASAQLEIATTTNVLGIGESTINGRLTSARLGTRQTGLAAGDQVGRGFTFWGQPFGAVSTQGASGGFDGWDAGTYGITLGADTLVQPNVRVGVALTLSNTNLSYSGTLSGNTGSIFTGELALYGTWYLPNNFFLDGLLGVGYNHYNRHNLISPLGLALDSDSGGTQITAKLGAGYDYKLPQGAVLTPYVSLQQFHFNFGSYSTTGGSPYDIDMHVNGNSADLTQTRVGAQLGEPVKLANGVLTPEIHAYWLHDFGTNQLTTTYTTADFNSPSFTMIGPALGRDNANIGIGATFAQGPGWSFTGGYDFIGGSGISTHNFYVQLKIPF